MKVSVIIPAYNASKTIRSCLQEIISQASSFDCEVIVVDDGSKDETSLIIKNEFKSVKLITQENAGPAKARNTGASVGSGDIIVFTDSDCVPDKGWLKAMVSPFKDREDIVGVKGIYKTKQKEIVARFVQIEYEDKYDVMRRYKYIDFIDTYSAAFLKKAFWEVGGYDCRFRVACSEDVDLSFKLSNLGYKMVFNPAAVVWHIHPSRFWDYMKKKYKFAYWRMLAIKNNPNKAYKDTHTPQTMKFQLLVPPIFLLVLLLTFFDSMFWFRVAGILLVLFFVLCMDFIIKAIKKDFTVGISSFFFLFFRSFAQFLGVFKGAIDVFLLNKFSK